MKKKTTEHKLKYKPPTQKSNNIIKKSKIKTQGSKKTNTQKKTQKRRRRTSTVETESAKEGMSGRKNKEDQKLGFESQKSEE